MPFIFLCLNQPSFFLLSWIEVSHEHGLQAVSFQYNLRDCVNVGFSVDEDLEKFRMKVPV